MPGDELGCAIAVDGHYAAVGACGDGWHSGVTHSGAVYMVDIGSGRIDSVLVAPDANPYMNFGSAIAMTPSGYVLVGASRDNPLNLYTTGAVHVYIVMVDGAGNRQIAHRQKLVAQDPIDEARFGAAIAVSGRTAAIGARGPDNYPPGLMTPQGNGAVYLFDVPTGQQLAKVAPVDTAGNGALGCYWFGASLALTEHLLVVGAPRSRAPCANSVMSGSAFVCALQRGVGRPRALVLWGASSRRHTPTSPMYMYMYIYMYMYMCMYMRPLETTRPPPLLPSPPYSPLLPAHLSSIPPSPPYSPLIPTHLSSLPPSPPYSPLLPSPPLL